jgi:hypothetical protein
MKEERNEVRRNVKSVVMLYQLVPNWTIKVTTIGETEGERHVSTHCTLTDVIDNAPNQKTQQPGYFAVPLSATDKTKFSSKLLGLRQNNMTELRFLDAFAKLQKATISFVMSVCLFVYPHGTTRLPMERIS